MKKNILDYLERTKELYPDKTAADDGEHCLTWREIWEKSRKLGAEFAKLTSPGQPVAILLEKSSEVLTVMFGTVYAGCFYVMIDPAQPGNRLEEILKVLSPGIVVTDEEHQEFLRSLGYGEKIFLPGVKALSSPDECRLEEIRGQMKPEDLLYGTFTSGSTGIPKCVAVSHGAVTDFIGHFVELFGIREDDRIGNQAPFDFDVSVKDIYCAVFTGAELVMIPRKLFSVPPRLLDYLCDRKVTVMIWAVSALCLISSLKGLKYKTPGYARLIMFSGEVMPVKQLRLWQQALPHTKFVNLYGPSEITCNCTWYPVEREFQDGETVPAGRAFPGRKVFLLDENDDQILASEQRGEICVAGESLANGYYHNTEETKARFMTGNPLMGEGMIRYYRTGDLGYFGKDGELYFAGRRDFQIKHMGHRIELEEVERSFEKLEEVSRCCCLFDRKRNRLMGFYTGNGEEKEVHEKLKSYLPAYMIPAKIYHLDAMPLNKNGKIDRKQLALEWEK